MRFVRSSLIALALLAALVATLRAQEVFEPGNGVSLPSVVTSVKPQYTPQAMAAGIEGTVLLQIVVQADGNVGDVTVERSLDSELGLDKEAVSAAKQWTFKPGTKDGKAVMVRVHLEMKFTLK